MPSELADTEPRDVGVEAMERFQNDAEFHALAYMAAVLTAHDVENMRGRIVFTDVERAIAMRAAATAVLLTERKATVDAAKKKTDWSGTK